MIDSSANTLFQLLRLALGNKAECDLPSDINWQSLIDLSFDQGVAAIAVDGLQRSLERGFAHDNDTLRYDNDNYEGVEFSLDSPELEDLKYEWFGATFQAEEDYIRNNEVVQKLRDENLGLRDVKVIRDDYKHTGFMYKGVMVEYHKSLIAWKSLKNGRFIEKTLRDVGVCVIYGKSGELRLQRAIDRTDNN